LLAGLPVVVGVVAGLVVVVVGSGPPLPGGVVVSTAVGAEPGDDVVGAAGAEVLDAGVAADVEDARVSGVVDDPGTQGCGGWVVTVPVVAGEPVDDDDADGVASWWCGRMGEGMAAVGRGVLTPACSRATAAI
jgi:hypothetical protein